MKTTRAATIALSEESSRLLKDVEERAGRRRLRDVSPVHEGRNFLLASAQHVGSGQRVLLVITRNRNEQSFSQLREISTCLAQVGDVGLATVLDRVWPDEQRTAPGGQAELPQWGCLVITWHEGQTLENIILAGAGHAKRPNLLCLLRTLAAQLNQIHHAGFAHGDLSTSNVIVSPTGVPHLIDLEYLSHGAIHFAHESFETQGYSHPDRIARIASEDYQLADLQAWDRYAFGKLVLTVLSDASPYLFEELTLFNQRALRLIGCLLLDGNNSTHEELALGLDRTFFQSNAFTNLDDVVEAFDRILGNVSPAAVIPELRPIPEKVVEVGTVAPAAFTSRVKALLETHEMRQLGTFQQLGLISFIWPTATHTRLEHALGTYSLTCAAVSNLYADPQNPLFAVLVPWTASRALIAAALLHDVGHYAMAHDLEEAVPGVFDHEQRSTELIDARDGRISAILEAPESGRAAETVAPTSRNGWGVSAADVASIIVGSPQPGSLLSESISGLLHSVISGTLDVDKLDYLVRDSRILGVRAGEGIDTRRILSALTVVVVPQTRKSSGKTSSIPASSVRLGVRAKGIRPAELVGRVRSHMFGVVYWHHSYRAIKSMVHWIVWDAISNRSKSGTVTASASESLARLVKQTNSNAVLFNETGDAPADLGILPYNEGRLLARISQEGSETAKYLFALLADKRWYKAILTVEHPDNGGESNQLFSQSESKAWIAAEKLPSADISSINARMAAAVRFQELVMNWLDRRTEGEVVTLVQNWGDEKNRLRVAARRQQLFLLDMVEMRKASESGSKRLYFAVGERADARASISAAGIPVRVSYDQSRLEAEFVASNASIRMFCHPDFDQFVVRSIPHETLLEFLLASLELKESKPSS